MMFDMFNSADRLARYRHERRRHTLPCTSWHGHDFCELNEDSILCLNCGVSKRLDVNDEPLPCYNWYGHRFQPAKDNTAIYCGCCGQVRQIIAKNKKPLRGNIPSRSSATAAL